MLTHQAAYPVHRATVEKFGAEWTKPGNLVSNGAFTLAEWVPNDHVKIVKNPKFHDADGGEARRRELLSDHGQLRPR